MSKTIQQSIIILIVLLVISVGVSVMTLLQKMGLEKQTVSLQEQVSDYSTRERTANQKAKSLEADVQKLRQDIQQKMHDVDEANRQADDARHNADRISGDLTRIQRDRDDLDGRLTTLRRERDDLMDKLRNRPAEVKTVEKIVEKNVYLDPNGQPLPADYKPGTPIPGAAPADSAIASPSDQATPAPTTVVVQNTANEDYWAGVARQKAALELELIDVKKKLGVSDMKIEELKKGNSDLEIEIGRLKNEREEIVRKIKYGEDLADSLSVELARSRNDQKMTDDRAEKVSADNQQLRGQIKDLSATKVALEKSIAKLSDDKTQVEKKLVETENIIQSRIDEIWQIKKDVDNRFDARKSAGGEVELAPIVVNASAGPVKDAPAPAPRHNGNVVSVNDENNFVVINQGENDGVHVGDVYKVYRGAQSIGVVSVIQVRKDIAAADIKQKASPFKPGDTVK